jgi:hypothetical protein
MVQFALIVPLGEMPGGIPGLPGQLPAPGGGGGYPGHLPSPQPPGGPGYPGRPVDPCYGRPEGGRYPGRPVDPDYGIPEGLRPDQGLPVPPSFQPSPPPGELANKVIVAVYRPGQGWTCKSYEPPGHPDQGLPGAPPRPDQGLPPTAQPR